MLFVSRTFLLAFLPIVLLGYFAICYTNQINNLKPRTARLGLYHIIRKKDHSLHPGENIFPARVQIDSPADYIDRG